MARAWPRAISLPRKPAVAASMMAAMIASGLVGIGNDLSVDRPDEGGMSVDVQADAPLSDRTGIGLQRLRQQRLRGVSGEGEEEMFDALGRDTVPIERLVDRVDERCVSAELHQSG